mmetsp:Transcript_3987/g.12973  ORF Transcript_3987/g.12973 Transcript_3987/m.12973 type:complete len:233 (-) Transcript_3987:1155-1853(-)
MRAARTKPFHTLSWSRHTARPDKVRKMVFTTNFFNLGNWPTDTITFRMKRCGVGVRSTSCCSADATTSWVNDDLSDVRHSCVATMAPRKTPWSDASSAPGSTCSSMNSSLADSTDSDEQRRSTAPAISASLSTSSFGRAAKTWARGRLASTGTRKRTSSRASAAARAVRTTSAGVRSLLSTQVLSTCRPSATASPVTVATKVCSGSQSLPSVAVRLLTMVRSRARTRSFASP